MTRVFHSSWMTWLEERIFANLAHNVRWYMTRVWQDTIFLYSSHQTLTWLTISQTSDTVFSSLFVAGKFLQTNLQPSWVAWDEIPYHIPLQLSLNYQRVFRPGHEILTFPTAYLIFELTLLQFILNAGNVEKVMKPYRDHQTSNKRLKQTTGISWGAFGLQKQG